VCIYVCISVYVCICVMYIVRVTLLVGVCRIVHGTGASGGRSRDPSVDPCSRRGPGGRAAGAAVAAEVRTAAAAM
jgi:hypothetical protein